MTRAFRLLVPAGLALVAAMAVSQVDARGAADPGWDVKAAAAYLDGRAEWWTTWPNAARDRGTYCMSCHTTLPYAIARPELRQLLAEHGPSVAERRILTSGTLGGGAVASGPVGRAAALVTASTLATSASLTSSVVVRCSWP